MSDRDKAQGGSPPTDSTDASASAPPPQARGGRLRRAGQFLADLKKKWSPLRAFVRALPPWMTANRVTIARALLVVPAWLFVSIGQFWPALTVFGLAMLLDVLDGAIAEVRDQQSTLGAFLDPLADKILVCGCLLAMLKPLAWYFHLPVTGICLFAVGLTLVRVIKLIRFRKQKPDDGRPTTVAAKLAGKVKCWTEVGSVVVVMVGLGLPSPNLTFIGFFLLTVAMALGAASFWSQLKDFWSGSSKKPPATGREG